VTAPEPPSLPPGVDLARDDVRGDPAAAEARGMELLAASGEAIVAGVEAAGARYVTSRAADLLDAWGGVPAARRSGADDEVAAAASVAVARVVGELRSLLAADPAHQPRTPLQIVRTLPREPAAVLMALGVPPIVRDAFEERALPDDLYGLAPRTLADLGDAELGAMVLAWGVGKATVLRARAAAAEDAPSATGAPEGASIGTRATELLRGLRARFGRGSGSGPE
jgi:hypothetical protein